MGNSESRSRRFLDEINGIHSWEQLKGRLGELTPEEKAFLDSIDLDLEPTEEELAVLGDDFFIECIKEKVLARIRASEQTEEDTVNDR